MTIVDEFKSIAGFELPSRRANMLGDHCERKDGLFPRLAVLYYHNPAAFHVLLKRIGQWLRENESETLYAAAGYLHYIQEDFKKARFYFLKNVSLNPDNLDNWMDLAFTLRHLKDYETSYGILFFFDYVIHYFKALNLRDCPYSQLRHLVGKIKKSALET